MKHRDKMAMLQNVFPDVCEQYGIERPVREFRFDRTKARQWRFDYAWPAMKIALEVDGGIFGIGKKCPACGQKRRATHSSISGIKRDIEKINTAQVQGWNVYRVIASELCRSSTLNLISAAIAAKQ